jgi:hypothetical protein
MLSVLARLIFLEVPVETERIVEVLHWIDVDDVWLMIYFTRLDWLTCTTSIGGAKRVVSTGVSSIYVCFSLLSDK